MKKVVQFCMFESVYNENLQKELIGYAPFSDSFKNISINMSKLIEEFEFAYTKKDNLSFFGKIVFWIKFNLFLINKFKHLKNSIVNVQYVDFSFFLVLPFLCITFERIILSFWGSDLLRQKDIKLKMMKLLFRKANLITFETDEMKNIFLKKVGRKYEQKLRIVKFGISELKLIDGVDKKEIEKFQSKFKIEKDKKYITIGYNRFRKQRHLEVIESLISSNVESNEIFIIIPWTYGQSEPEYKEEIINRINGKYHYVFLNDRLSDMEIACLRVITNVLIQVQPTDSLSSTMLETLYAGNDVLTGSWLPYDGLFDMGVYMHTVDSVDDVGKTLKEILFIPQMSNTREKNIKLINDMCSWETNISSWCNLYF